MEAASSYSLSCDAKHVYLYVIIIAFYNIYLADCVGLDTDEMRTTHPPPKNDRLAFEKMAEAGRSHSDLFLPFFPEAGYESQKRGSALFLKQVKGSSCDKCLVCPGRKGHPYL